MAAKPGRRVSRAREGGARLRCRHANGPRPASLLAGAERGGDDAVAALGQPQPLAHLPQVDERVRPVHLRRDRIQYGSLLGNLFLNQNYKAGLKSGPHVAKIYRAN